MSARPDLLALDDDALATLANRGLLKRASKDLARGQGPTVEVLEDGTVVGRHGDTTSTLAPGVPLKQTECTCGASRVCRHRVATVLAYRAEFGADDGAPPAPDAAHPPLDLHDAVLEARLGKAAWAAAGRARALGYSATVRFEHPPRVLLPTCTVAFLVPWDPSHVRCDCEIGVDCEHVALAVWALRACESLTGEHTVGVAGAQPELRGEAALEAFGAFTEELVARGWAGALDGSEARTAALFASLKKARFVWLHDLLEALLDAIREHDAGLVGADALDCARLLTEAYARAHAQPSSSTPQANLHGEGATGATKMDRVVLRGLGARYRVQGRVGRLSLFFRERASSDALVLTKTWTVEPEHTPPAGAVIGGRRLVGSETRVVATSNVTTTGATRRPNREVAIRARGLETSVMRGTGARLEAEADYAAAKARIAERAPSLFGPRVRAWRVLVVRFGRVVLSGWDPGAQTVWGVLADEADGTIVVTAAWTPEAPAAPGLLSRALVSGAAYLTGEATLRRGTLWLEPLTIGFEGEPAAVDLARDEVPIEPLPVAPLPAPDDPVGRAAVAARDWLGSTTLRGVDNLTAAQLEQGRAQIDALRQAGLLRLADAVARLVQIETDRASAWGRAATRAELTLRALARG